MNSKDLFYVIGGIDEELIEIAEKKERNDTMFKKRLLVVFAIISLLAILCVSANAATDGAIVEYISSKITVLINGNKVEADSFTDENGTKHIKLNGDIPDGEVVIRAEDGETEDIIEYKIQKDENSVEFGVNFDTVLEADNLHEPTTSVN